MQQLRRDPVTGRWIIIHYDRTKGPQDFKARPRKKPHELRICPFCPGHEDKTPPELYADRAPQAAPDNPGWNLRVIANKFPALRVEGDINREGIGIYDQMNGVGAHEVVIETPEHKRDMAQMSAAEVSRVILAYKSRCVDLKNDRRFEYIVIFKNHGETAGASLEHPHSQLIALPIVPKRVREALRGAEAYFQYKERCVYCDIIMQELEDKERVVSENEHFLALCPFASNTPFETWIIPRKHSAQFFHIEEDMIGDLAEILRRTLLRLKKLLGDPPFNYIVNTAPIQHDQELEYYHWHIEIAPKLTKVAGFEWGTGFYLNPAPPEDAARRLRGVRLSKNA